MTPSPTLAQVARGELCVGCGLCQAVTAPGRIKVALDASSYIRPTQLTGLSPQEERMIAATCPGIHLERASATREDHALWGSYRSVRTGYAIDSRLRHGASSGGVLSALLVHLLETRAVDYVLQTAASETSPIENTTVESRTHDEVMTAAGSRYAPSAPLLTIDKHLDRAERIAFVGKPCDVAALRALARRDARVDERIPYMISFFCAGIPSQNATRTILERLGVSEEDVTAFRYRGDGWPGFATAVTKDGRTRCMSYADSWGAILSHHVQFRCKICPDGTGGFADVVCADAWYGDERGYPIFDEADGRSLVVSRTAKGEALVRAALEAARVELEDIDVGEIAKMQPGQARRKMLVLSRLAALTVFGRVVPRYRGFHLARAARRAGVWPNVRSFLGLVRRILLGRAA